MASRPPGTLMQSIPLQTEWLANIFPGGWPVGSSTVITGPGGSGKPLLGNVVIDSWLKAGGSVIFLSLQYPDRRFTYESFQRVTGSLLTDYDEKIAFVDLDPSLTGTGENHGRGFSANLVYPSIWTESLKRALAMVPGGSSQNSGPGVLISASALNLLLFSPTWADRIGDAICATMRDPRFTTIFSVSSKPKEALVRRIVQTADTVLYTERPGEKFELYLEVRKTPQGSVPSERTRIPIPPEELEATKEIAEHSRQRVIPAISAI